MKLKQQNFLKELNQNNRKSYGGITKGKRKIARPISTKKWMHLTLKSKKAKGNLSLLYSKNIFKIKDIIKKQAYKHGVEVSDYVNMGNHLHLKVKPSTRTGFQNFLKSTTAMIARFVTGANKNNSFGKFWDALAYTRVIQSSYEVFQLQGYFNANRIQSKRGYRARVQYLDAFNEYLRSLSRESESLT